jgi:hypothetical protein
LLVLLLVEACQLKVYGGRISAEATGGLQLAPTGGAIAEALISPGQGAPDGGRVVECVG